VRSPGFHLYRPSGAAGSFGETHPGPDGLVVIHIWIGSVLGGQSV